MTALLPAMALGSAIGDVAALFRKPMPSAQADAEIRGWNSVASGMPVPALVGRIRRPSGDLVLYEDVFSSGRCSLLLGDLIAQADRDQALIPCVEELIDGIRRDLCTAVRRTGQVQELAACVSGLYADRLRPGGRIESWYTGHDLALYREARRQLTLQDLAEYHLTIGERTYRVDIERIIMSSRRAQHSRR